MEFAYLLWRTYDVLRHVCSNKSTSYLVKEIQSLICTVLFVKRRLCVLGLSKNHLKLCGQLKVHHKNGSLYFKYFKLATILNSKLGFKFFWFWKHCLIGYCVKSLFLSFFPGCSWYASQRNARKGLVIAIKLWIICLTKKRLPYFERHSPCKETTNNMSYFGLRVLPTYR